MPNAAGTERFDRVADEMCATELPRVRRKPEPAHRTFRTRSGPAHGSSRAGSNPRTPPPSRTAGHGHSSGQAEGAALAVSPNQDGREARSSGRSHSKDHRKLFASPSSSRNHGKATRGRLFAFFDA